MKIIVTGLSHKRTPVEIRERLAFDGPKTIKALTELKNKYSDSEFAIISTCNRVELYCVTRREGGVSLQNLTHFLSVFHNIKAEEFENYLYVHQDWDAVKHLLTVASSLDSMVIGEGQIIGQVKESYKSACSAKSTGKVLNRLFHCAFSTSKEIYTKTSISVGRVSVAGVAVELAMQFFAEISSAKIVVIGAGEMGELLLQHLLHCGCKNIKIVNRSYQNGLELANHYHVTAENWESLAGQLNDCDIVIASAAGWNYLFTKEKFEKILENKRMKPLLIIDIAVPRNFEPSVNEIENVFLYSIDELSDVAEQNRKAREEDIAVSRKIIQKNSDEFMEWFGARDLGPLIGQLKENFCRISKAELELFITRNGKDAESARLMVDRIVNKLLHCVIKNVNSVAREHGPSEAAKIVDSIVRQAKQMSEQTAVQENKKS